MAKPAVERAQDFADSCIKCGLCARCDCGNYPQGTPCLGDICESMLNGEDTYFSFAFTCGLCNRCTAKCPAGLKANEGMRALRAIGLERYPSMKDNYRHFRTDLKYNLFSLMAARAEGEGYENQLVKGEGGICELADSTAFFPGCSLFAYSPDLVEKVFDWLRASSEAAYQLNICCGSLVYDTGFAQEFESYRAGACKLLAEHGIKRVIVCCPHCAHILPSLFEGADIEIVRMTEVLLKHGMTYEGTGRYCVHDACYDRAENLYGNETRQMMAGMEEVHLAHEKRQSVCCGGGGMVSLYAPQFCDFRREMRFAEIDAVDTDMVVSTCYSCVNSMQRGADKAPVRHYLELLFDVDVDWPRVYASVDEAYADPQVNELLTNPEPLF